MNMNRKQAMRWISRSIDGDLSADQEKQLAAYLADHPDRQSRTGERLPVDHLAGQTQFQSNFTDFILEQEA